MLVGEGALFEGVGLSSPKAGVVPQWGGDGARLLQRDHVEWQPHNAICRGQAHWHLKGGH